MTRRELDAAGITDPALRAAYTAADGSTPATARPTSSPPGCCRWSAARPCTRCTASPAGPTTSWTTWTGPRHPPSATGACADLESDLAHGLRTGGERRTGRPGPGRHRRPVPHRPPALHRLHGLHAQRPDASPTTRPRRPAGLHARLRRGDRAADAARARHGRATRGGGTARRGPRGRLPAHQLPARRGRRPGPGPRLPARGPARRARRGPAAAGLEPPHGSPGSADQGGAASPPRP